MLNAGVESGGDLYIAMATYHREVMQSHLLLTPLEARDVDYS